MMHAKGCSCGTPSDDGKGCIGEPNVTLPEGIENAIRDLVIAAARVLHSEPEKAAQTVLLTELLTTIRREIAAGMMEAQADVWPMGASDLRARARAIRERK